MEIVALEQPLPADVIEELAQFWEAIFEASYDDLRPVLAGAEVADNRNLIYLIREGGQLAGTSQLTTSRAVPALGGLGEVATAPAYRGRGIATRLCARARDDFRAQGGQALYLGTVNPAAGAGLLSARLAQPGRHHGDGRHDRRRLPGGLPC